MGTPVAPLQYYPPSSPLSVPSPAAIGVGLPGSGSIGSPLVDSSGELPLFCTVCLCFVLFYCFCCCFLWVFFHE